MDLPKTGEHEACESIPFFLLGEEDFDLKVPVAPRHSAVHLFHVDFLFDPLCQPLFLMVLYADIFAGFHFHDELVRYAYPMWLFQSLGKRRSRGRCCAATKQHCKCYDSKGTKDG